MTPAQRSMLFRLFSQAMNTTGIVGTTARDLERERITIKVFGSARSWSTFNNKAVDAMKGALLAILNPGDMAAQLRQIQMPRTRLFYSIRNAADPAYIAKIAFDKFDTRDIESLDDDQLYQLSLTLNNRARKHRREKVEEPF